MASLHKVTPPDFDHDYDFTPPSAAPVFTPTMEEFRDALGYFEKIRPIAEQYGICKIRPPDEWQPPFAVDVDKLRFTPRIQRLNELEAHTRIKLNFLDTVAKFWELQGSSLKIPIVEGKALDLFTLKKYVNKLGGMDKVNGEKLWPKVGQQMGYNPASAGKTGQQLKAHYERILYPLDVFQKEEAANKDKEAQKEEVKEKKVDTFSSLMKPTPNKKGRMLATVSEEDSKTFSKELARLAFYGAGPKLPGMPTDKTMKEKTRGVKLNFEYDPLSKYMCQNCGKGDAEEQMLLCDGCDDSYHTFCLMPPLAEIPQGDWRCPKCVAAEVSKPSEAFGFEQAQKEYTLQSFGEMADQFKSDYFNMPVHLIPTSLVEKEYWRILDNIDEDVVVEYGADLHSMDHGSGFPTVTSKHLSKEDDQYARSEWNLNNLPVVPNSILRHTDADISGMKVPWLYVGMCFSTFCWHVEDHWTPSINFHHWGEPKTWYGIPSKCAEKAEEVMQSSAKELFDSQPDLLHHIVTTMNPNVLQQKGVSVFKMDQYPGEFIITFPRAYHAGFNHGYNLAEAVNFAPPDWLPIGRKCVEHYSMMRRFCVFCHDELLCRMAQTPQNLTLQVAAMTYKDMLTMVENEKIQRRALLDGGVREAEREMFEKKPEDERQCAVCKTTCFLSAIVSTASEKKEIVCLRHFRTMNVDPSSIVLKYRYTLDELVELLQGIKVRADSYESWVSKVQTALQAQGDDKLDYEDLKRIYVEARELKYPESEIMEALQLTVEEAEKCTMVAQQLCSKGKIRTRTRGMESKYRLTIEELELYANQLESLPARLADEEGVQELLQTVQKIRADARALLETNDAKMSDIEKCLDDGDMLDIELPEINQLKVKSERLQWIEEAEELLSDPGEVTLTSIKALEMTGFNLPPHQSVERQLSRLAGLWITLEKWEEKAEKCLEADPKMSLSEVELLVQEGEQLSTALPSLINLKDACRKAREWWARAEALQRPENYPYVDNIEILVNKGKHLPIRLDPLPQLESQVLAAKAWRERTARVFLKKNSHLSLLEVLSPRQDFGSSTVKRKKRVSEDSPMSHPIFQGLSAIQLSDPQEIVSAFKNAENVEMLAVREFRGKNKQNEQAEEGIKIDCELCLQKFSANTIALPRLGTGKGRHKPGSLRDIKFLCPGCLRSRRPRLETILSLLVSLQKLSVRVPEGEALQCLTERAMAWQDKARQALSTQQLSSCLARLTDLDTSDGADDNSMDNTTTDSEGESAVGSGKKQTSRAVKGERDPVIELPAATLQVLEELLIDGDLLEVSLDEVHHIWRLIQATPERRSKKYPELEQLEAELVAARDAKKRQKSQKRLMTEAAAAGAKEKRKEKRRKKTEETEKRKKEEADSEDDCSAKSPKCRRPTGRQVHWVQCDGCQLWFHLFCIGVRPSQIREDEDFMCKDCDGIKKVEKKAEEASQASSEDAVVSMDADN